jgi:hypothetical protein
MNITMKYQNLSSLFIFFFILASCHSTEVVLRKSKVHAMAEPEQELENNTPTYTNKEAFQPEISKIAPLQEKVNPPVNQDFHTEQKNAYTYRTINISKQQKANLATSPTHIKHQNNQYIPNASTKKISKQPSNGFFGGIGQSFGVVGLVFIVVGLILFLIGGLIIDTLGAVFLAFGLVFLLIWLVLAIIQGLFDVIL